MIYIYFAVPLILIVLFFVLGIDNNLAVTEYNMKSSKIEKAIKIAVISDLHSCDYGVRQENLINAIISKSPDIVVMPGDIIDNIRPTDKTMEFFEEITKLYPCYFVSGNHEIRIGDLPYVKNVIRNKGIEVLDGNCTHYESLSICGIDDYELGKEVWYKQLQACSSTLETKNFNILLSHRPEKFTDYMKYDLVIAGHAHGGQWRIPHIFNGIYSPGQGFFPEYAGGIYELNNTTLVVSRGLAKESTKIPRVFNPPEIVIININ